MQALGPRIKKLRLEAGLNKAALARLVGVSDVTVSYWESGAIKQIGHERLVALANAFDCPLSELLSDEAPGTPQILRLSTTPPEPWHQRPWLNIPTSLVSDDTLPTECYLATPGDDEVFDFLSNGDLAAIVPLNTFQHAGLYLIEHQQRVMIRHLEQGPNGELQLLRDAQSTDDADIADASLRLYGKLQTRWRLQDTG